MQLALYEPGLGYYANTAPKFGAMPASGSDFITAPELSPLFGQTLAVQVREALDATGSDDVWEFGAGSGALAAQMMKSLGERVHRYHIVDVSGTLRARQQAALAAWGEQVQWHDTLPEAISGVVIGNEVLDAMPVQLLARLNGVWHERGVALHGNGFAWADRPSPLQPPFPIEGEHDVVTEIHPQARAFISTLAACLRAGTGGAAFFLDYGFPEAEYYHPQRIGGTLVCHRAHQVDDNPLIDVGIKDITAHVDFTGIAMTAQDAGLSVLGYTSQGRFLLNCGMAELMQTVSLPERATAMKLVAEHEMGELFKVIGFSTSDSWVARGFAEGDRTHRL
ncbi:class I SAM-dependent methyltransferase [Ottowia thiooxydans]|uniref:class I SAM-dependent methyltransferase n=1 Tax=Ottowia thiooxydans TaxID=219182 RepID=UPI0012EC13D9|nr:SAM-dependent methyltransferase [Ottowia thiooxydans]